MSQKIALFGTSADPPTAGHQTILKWLGEQYDWVAVWASDNPYKAHQTPLEHRLTMLRLLIEDIDPYPSNIKVYEELSHLRSLISVQKAKEIWGNEQDYYLVIGSDLVKQICQWYQVKTLFQQVKLLIIPRPHYPINTADMQAIENLGGSYLIANFNTPAVSSSAYRKKQDQNVITQPIQAYIHRQKLYL